MLHHMYSLQPLLSSSILMRHQLPQDADQIYLICFFAECSVEVDDEFAEYLINLILGYIEVEEQLFSQLLGEDL